MINARQSLDLLLSSDKLDGLLAAARSKVANIEKKKHPAGCTGKQASELADHVEQVKEMSAKAVKELREALQAKSAQRAEKVAIVRHLLHFGSKIQPTAA
ncbi:MAG: hypothetical protein WC869_00395 [Phycisphaerae bacterium]|jgi:hypothetical protein